MICELNYLSLCAGAITTKKEVLNHRFDHEMRAHLRLLPEIQPILDAKSVLKLKNNNNNNKKL